MTLSDMSYRKNARNASVISRSWMVATTAPTPKLNWKRNARYARMPTSDSTVAQNALARQLGADGGADDFRARSP